MNIKNELLISSFYNILSQWASRFIGLFSILILARTLAPEDFGIVTILYTCYAFFELISMFGSYRYLVQKVNITSDDINTAWTLVFIGRIIFFILFLTTSFALFDTSYQQYALPLFVYSFLFVIKALETQAFNILKKELKYKVIFNKFIKARLAQFIVVISVALSLKNYWALIIGDIFITLAMTIISYRVKVHKPKFCFTKMREQWDYVCWLIPERMLFFLKDKIDLLFAGKIFGVGFAGSYSVAYRISEMPSKELVTPLVENIYAALSIKQRDSNGLDEQFALSYIITNLILIPICILTSFYSSLIITTLLGEKWAHINGLLTIMIWVCYFQSNSNLLSNVLFLESQTKRIFYINLLSFIVTLLGIFIAAAYNSEELFVIARVASAFICFCIFYYSIKYSRTLKQKTLLIVLTYTLCYFLILLSAMSYLASEMGSMTYLSFASSFVLITLLALVYVITSIKCLAQKFKFLRTLNSSLLLIRNKII